MTEYNYLNELMKNVDNLLKENESLKINNEKLSEGNKALHNVNINLNKQVEYLQENHSDALRNSLLEIEEYKKKIKQVNDKYESLYNEMCKVVKENTDFARKIEYKNEEIKDIELEYYFKLICYEIVRKFKGDATHILMNNEAGFKFKILWNNFKKQEKYTSTSIFVKDLDHTNVIEIANKIIKELKFCRKQMKKIEHESLEVKINE